MGKRIITLYCEDEDVDMAKSKMINLSSFFRNLLKVELYNEESKDKSIEQKMDRLKIKLAKITGELKTKNEEIKKLKEKIDKNKPKEINWRQY